MSPPSLGKHSLSLVGSGLLSFMPQSMLPTGVTECAVIASAAKQSR